MPCPACDRISRRVHSRYERRLADAPAGGRRVVIWLQVRRLFCDVPACAERTFAGQVPGLTARYGRKTALLAGMQRDIAVALAGRAGCRLARDLGLSASRQVLLRLVMAIPDPEASTTPACSWPIPGTHGPPGLGFRDTVKKNFLELRRAGEEATCGTTDGGPASWRQSPRRTLRLVRAS